MKKYLYFLVLGIMVLSLSGCSEEKVSTDETTSNTSSPTSSEETTQTDTAEKQDYLFDAEGMDTIQLTGQEILDGKEADMSVEISGVGNINMDFHISRDDPNGVKLYATYEGNAINFASNYMNADAFDENGEAISSYYYQISCYDFNHDDFKEVVIASGNKEDQLSIYVFEPYVEDSSLFVLYNYILGYTTAYVNDEDEICVLSPTETKPYKYYLQAYDPEYARLTGEIKISYDYATEEQLNQYAGANEFVIDEEGPSFLILPKEKITDFELSHVEYNGDNNNFDQGEVLYSIEELTPDKPLILKFYMPDVAGLKASYTMESGMKQSVVIGESGEDGSIFLIEQGENNNAVSQNTTNTSETFTNYDVIPGEYSEDIVTTRYPQLSNFADENMQAKVNDMIANDNQDIMRNLIGSEWSTIDMDYEVTFTGSDIFSSKYLGLVSAKDAAYPTNIFYTVNVNLKDGTKIELKDIINIDNSLIEKFKNGVYKPYSDDLNLEEAGALQDVLDSIDNNDMISQLENGEAAFYFDDETLVLSMQVPHVVGDHIEMGIYYGDLGSSLQIVPQ